jgi:hypothetical protein
MKDDNDEEAIAAQDAIPEAAYVLLAPTVLDSAAPLVYVESVEVVAPAALAGGYQFHVDAGVDAGASQSALVEVVRGL